MTRPSERELRSAVESLNDEADDDDATVSDVCCSWKGDCEHDEHDIVIQFGGSDT